MYWDDFEITKREVLASIAIIAVLLIVGLRISDGISDKIADKNEKYNKAIKIESTEIFDYGMRTNVGNAFVYGELKAVDPVSYPDIKGKYIYIEKVTEKYTQHTRTVTTTDSKGKTHTKTETYWTWDPIDSESKHSKELMFCGIKFPYKKIDIPGAEYIDTISTRYRLRDVYYGTKAKHKGTIFTKLKDGTISDKSSFYNDKKTEETKEHLTKGEKGWLIVFWVAWIVLIIACVIGFYYFENDWLEE